MLARNDHTSRLTTRRRLGQPFGWLFLALMVLGCFERPATAFSVNVHWGSPRLERDDVEADEITVRLLVVPTDTQRLPHESGTAEPLRRTAGVTSAPATCRDPHDCRAPPALVARVGRPSP